MLTVSTGLAIRNRILAALPHEEYTRLEPNLKSVNLDRGEIVYLRGDDIEYVFFPNSGLLSLRSTTETGATIEVASVGNEGIVGLPVILKNRMIPYEVTVQFNSEAFKISAAALQEEFDKGQTLYEYTLRYLNVLIVQMSQSSTCNRFHNLNETLRCWLLTVQDRVNSDQLNVTQETISQTLGVPRTAITKAAGELQKAGVIRYNRGKISILDRAGLEAQTCECYGIIRNELNDFLSYKLLALPVR